MKNHNYFISTFLILIAQLSFGQELNIKGKVVDYESNNAIPSVMIHESENTENGTVSDISGDFEIKLQGNTRELQFNYLSFYVIKFLNLPIIDNNTIDIGEIKLVPNHQMEDMTIGGPPVKTTEEQIEKDKRLRQHVLKNYKIGVLEKKLTPYFEENFLVFDFNKL